MFQSCLSRTTIEPPQCPRHTHIPEKLTYIWITSVYKLNIPQQPAFIFLMSIVKRLQLQQAVFSWIVKISYTLSWLSHTCMLLIVDLCPRGFGTSSFACPCGVVIFLSVFPSLPCTSELHVSFPHSFLSVDTLLHLPCSHRCVFVCLYIF